VISASNVTLDLNGFAISCNPNICGNAPQANGITVSGTGVTIMNGTIAGFKGPNPVGDGPAGIVFQGAVNGKLTRVSMSTVSAFAVDGTTLTVGKTRGLM
jgi:hypothetical protein